MPISSRPSLEDFINKGGSSSVGIEMPARPAQKNVASNPKPASKIASPTAAKKQKPAAAPPPLVAAPRQSVSGRTIGRPRKVNEPEALKFVMRIPPQISDQMAQVIEARKVPMSRNAWILEAIVEKLEKDAVGMARN